MFARDMTLNLSSNWATALPLHNFTKRLMHTDTQTYGPNTGVKYSTCFEAKINGCLVFEFAQSRIFTPMLDNPNMNSSHLMHHTKRHPSAILLLVQLLGMLLYPFIESTQAGHVVFNAFGIVVLAIATRMVRRTPGHAWISASIAGPVIVLLVLQMAFGMRQLLPWSSALEALFYFYAAGSLIAYMMEDRLATTDELFAAGATFTLLAWAFTHLFILLQALHPGTFAAAVNAADLRTWTELNYLSFALLSSTGIGDVIPLTAPARALASVEMFVGLMYLAAVVARLIGFTVQSNK